MRWFVAVFALLALLAGAFADSRDSNYNNICFVTGSCTGGGGTASPILFQSLVTSTNLVGSGTSYGPTFALSTEPLPANTVGVIAITSAVAKALSVSDTLVGSWGSALCTATGGTGNNHVSIFVKALGGTGGADTITVTAGTGKSIPLQFAVSFFENINTTTSTGGSLCSTSGGITPTSGGVVAGTSFTPTNNNSNGGNVIWSYAGLCGGTGVNGGVPSGVTAQSGSTLVNGEIAWNNSSNAGFPDASEWVTQATSAAFTPSFTFTGETAAGDCFNMASVALPIANNSATAPSTIHVASITHESSAGQTSPTTVKVVWPTVGNLRVFSTTWPLGAPGSGTPALTGLSSSDACAWTRETSNGADIWYAQNCSPSPTGTLTLTFTGAGAMPQYSWRQFDIQNANASSFQNYTSNNGACTVANSNDMPTITSSVTGLIIANNGIGTGPFTGFASGSPAGAVFDLWVIGSGNDSDQADNADAVGHAYLAAGTYNWNWTQAVGTEACQWGSAVFK